MRSFFLSSVLFLLYTTSYLSANVTSDDELRLMNSMSIEELLDVEIATGSSIKQKLAPAATSILTHDDIVKNGSRTLHEALEQVPGLHIYPSDLDLLTPKVSIRGIHTGYNPQLLFLIDGVRLNNLLHGDPGYVFRMPISIIHRIEVIRGPGSALHGADAFSGVINIVTKKFENIDDQIGTRYGSFNTWETWINKRVDLGKFTLGLNLSLMQSDGDDNRVIIDKGGTEGPLDTRYDTAYFHADAHYHGIDMNFMLERSRDIGVGQGHVYNLDPNGYIDRDKIVTDVKHINKTWIKDAKVIHTGYFSYIDEQANYNPVNTGPNAYRQGKPYAKEYAAGLASNIIYNGFDDHTINTKIGYIYGKLDPSQLKNFDNGGFDGTLVDVTDDPALTYMLEHSRTNYYGLVQDEYVINSSLILTAGVRYDYYDDFGSSFNPRVALVWDENEEITYKFLYGRAFRAPSFSELYVINSPQLLGNPDLKPETIDTYELVFNYRGDVYVKSNIFYYRAKNLIDYVYNVSLDVSEAQNVYKQVGYGLELELEYEFYENLIMRGNYAYQYSKNPDTDERIPNAPAHQGFIQFQYKPSQEWDVNTQYFYIGKRYRESGDTRDDLESDSLVNVSIQKKNVVKNLDALVSARNIFDEDYREPSNAVISTDYPMEGISVFLELRYRF